MPRAVRRWRFRRRGGVISIEKRECGDRCGGDDDARSVVETTSVVIIAHVESTGHASARRSALE